MWFPRGTPRGFPALFSVRPKSAGVVSEREPEMGLRAALLGDRVQTLTQIVDFARQVV